MKQLCLLILLVISSCEESGHTKVVKSRTTDIDSTHNEPKEKQVYICNSPYAKSYHYTINYEGLKNCVHPIEIIGISKAQHIGLRLCGYEE